MPDPSTDAQLQLLRRIAAQDRQALADFYDQTASALYSTSFRILGDAHEAEEVIQDVFVQIWNKAATFDASLGVPFTWALSITRNRSIDRLRARERRSRIADRLQETAVESDFAPAPDAGSLDADGVKAVRNAVNRLPADQRKAIELAFFGGLTHFEIAEAIQEPLGTVKARIRRGMLKLRDDLQVYV